MKTIALIFSLLIMFSIAWSNVLFYDDFNRANGAVGNGWTNISTANTSIEDNTMKVISDNGKGIRRDFTAISSGIYFIQYDWKITSDDWYADAFPTGAITHIIVDDAGNLCYDVDGTMSDPITLQNITFGTWNTVRLKVNLDTDRFSVWINNTLVAYNLAGTAVTSFTRFTFRAGLGAIVTQYVDNFVVYNEIAPATPTGFTATGHVNDVTLNWTAATDTDFLTYKIYRSTASPATTLLTEISGTLTQYVDPSALPNTDYFYRIKAVSMNTIESGFSTEQADHLQPHAVITPTNITFNVGYGYSDSTYINISNTGNYPLNWNVIGTELTSAIPTNGLVAYYPLDGNANDVSGNNRHGVINGLIPVSDRNGNMGGAMLIDSDDDYISVPDFNSPEISIAFLHYYNGTDGSCNSLLANRRNVPGNYNHLFTSPDNYIGDHPNTWNLSEYILQPGAWYQITVLKSYNHMKLYINNALIMDVNNSFNNAIAPLNIIGNVILTGSEAAYGIWDNILIYNRFLTENEVNSIYHNVSRLYSISQDTGTLQSGESGELVLTIGAYGKNAGTYIDTLYVNTNDPLHPQEQIDVTTNVLPPAPIITPDPLSVNLNVANTSRTTSIQLQNDGQGKLMYSLSGTDSFGNFNPLPAISGFTALGVYNGHRYYQSNSTMSWTAAKTLCEQNGGHLATITSAGENSYLYQNITADGWIGLTDEVTEGTWRWVNGEQFSYSNWGTGEPNNSGGNEDWVCLWKTGDRQSYWNDWGSSVILNAILEFDSVLSSSFLGFDPSSGTLIPIANTPISLTTTGTNLTDGVYSSSIRLDAQGVVAPYYFPVTVNVDYTPPIAVQSVINDDALTDADQIAISWTANAISDSVRSYKVYRRGRDDTNWTFLSSVNPTALSYIDRAFTPMDSTYVYYRVTAVDWVENEGAASDSLMASLKRYLAPTNLAINTVNNRHIHLSWNPVTHTISGTPGTPSCYIIYKSDSPLPLSDFDFLGISTTPEFTHSWAAYFQPQNRLFYIVTAYGGDVSEARAMVASRRKWKYGALQGKLNNNKDF